jgi:signal transduction histidine kinase
VSSLLDVSRLESGQPVADQKVVETLDLIRSAVRDVIPVAGGRHQALSTDLPDQLAPVWVDEDMARRVLINLLENASKFSPARGRIEIGAKEEAEFVHIWVKDNGPGIPVAEQDYIFDKFTRLHGNNKSAGLGIGLAFCRLAVLGHGGRIWVESEPGNGAVFHFTFPIATDEQKALPLEQER